MAQVQRFDYLDNWISQASEQSAAVVKNLTLEACRKTFKILKSLISSVNQLTFKVYSYCKKD